MMLLPLLLLVSDAEMIRPPMHRAWTALTNDNTDVHAVRSGTLFYTSRQGAGALSLESGKPVWLKKLNGWPGGAALTKTQFFVLDRGEKASRLLAFDLRNGTQRVLKNFSADVDEIACDERRIYVLLADASVQALDLSGRPIWTTPLAKGTKMRGVMLASLTAGYGKLCAGIDGVGFHSMDAATGRVLWKETAQYRVYERPILLPDGVVTFYKDPTKHRYMEAKPVWTFKTNYFQPHVVTGSVLIGSDSGRVQGIDLANGHQIWQGPEPDPNSGISIGGRDWAPPADDKGAIVAGEELTRFAKNGHVDWSVKPFYDGSPIYADAGHMIFNDHERLLCYVPGPPKPAPNSDTEQKSYALRQVEDFEKLDRFESELLVPFGRYAAKPLIAKFAEWALDNRENGPADREGRGQRLYGLLMETAPLLDRMCTPDDTEALVQAIEKVGRTNSYRDELVQVLGHRGDPNRAVPIFVEQLQAHPPKKGDYGGGGATLDAIAHSKHPAAVKFMLDALKDPKAPASWRSAAFVHLAGTGPEGIAAIRATRKQRGPLPTWESQISPDEGKVLSTKSDSKGRTWRLFNSRILGNSSDLFIEEKQGKGWSKAIFLGTYTSPTWTQPAPASYRGVPMAKLVESEWIKIFPDDPEIRKDRDSDGLTDLVEARLGTDPTKPDTDGDGLLDAVDPCPNTAPRALNDQEKIVAAAVEAEFFEEDWGTPAMIGVDGIEPFELYGYSRPIFWSTPEYKGSLPRMYNTGVNQIGFHAYSENFNDDVKGKPTFAISADGKSAVTMISRYSGGLDGEGVMVRLIKDGDDWFVVDLRTMYVS